MPSEIWGSREEVVTKGAQATFKCFPVGALHGGRQVVAVVAVVALAALLWYQHIPALSAALSALRTACSLRVVRSRNAGPL